MERRYSEQELAVILHRAARVAVHDERTFTLAEIERIASEAGIPPDAVKAALALPLVSGPPAGTSVLGASPVAQSARVVPGNWDRAQLAAVLAVLRERFGVDGEVREVAGTVEWSFDNGYRSAVASLATEGDELVVRITGRADGRQVAIYAGALATALVGLAPLPDATVATHLLLAAGTTTAALAVARAWWNRIAARQATLVGRVADEVAALLGRR